MSERQVIGREVVINFHGATADLTHSDDMDLIADAAWEVAKRHGLDVSMYAGPLYDTPGVATV